MSSRSRRLDVQGRHTQAVNRTNLKVVVDFSTFTENQVGTVPGQSTGIIINHGGNLAVRNSTFVSITEVQVDPRFANYIIGNMNGLLELTGNCFVETNINFAPVISHSDTFPLLSDNCGTATTKQKQCNFAVVYLNTGTMPVDSESNDNCMEYDRLSCTSTTGATEYDPPASDDVVDRTKTDGGELQFDSRSICALSSHVFHISLVLGAAWIPALW